MYFIKRIINKLFKKEELPPDLIKEISKIGVVGKVEIGNELVNLGVIKKPQQYIDFLQRPLTDPKSLALMFKAVHIRRRFYS